MARAGGGGAGAPRRRGLWAGPRRPLTRIASRREAAKHAALRVINRTVVRKDKYPTKVEMSWQRPQTSRSRKEGWGKCVSPQPPGRRQNSRSRRRDRSPRRGLSGGESQARPEPPDLARVTRGGHDLFMQPESRCGVWVLKHGNKRRWAPLQVYSGVGSRGRTRHVFRACLAPER